MSNEDPSKIAREAAQYLRHTPETLSLELDPKGWVSLSDLYQGFMSHTAYDFTEDFLRESLEDNNYRRFQFEGDLVRAVMGHTTGQVKYSLEEPPESGLFRTFSRRAYSGLMNEGIVSTKRKYTEMFGSPLAAFRDAKKRRIKNGILVSVDTHRAYHDGTLFYKHEGSWYVTEVEASHLELTDLMEDED